MAFRRVAITGASGFIGSQVARRLAERGAAIQCLLRPTSDTSRLDAPEPIDYQRRDGDVRDPEAVRAALEGADAVIHLAGVSSWNEIDSPDMREIVVGGTRNVLAAARALGSLRMVHVSSIAGVGARAGPEPMAEDVEYDLGGDPELVYSHAKHEAEVLCREAADAGQDVVVVNPAEVYGPDDHKLITAGNLVDFARSNPVLVCRGGTSIAHVDDVAEGIVLALEKGRAGERYFLGGDNLTHRELAAKALQILGKKARIVTVPNGVLRTMTRTAVKLRIPLPYNPKVIPYATRYWFVDRGKAERELGVSFRSADETLAPTLAWLREAGHIA